jgi:hypothetical protein
MTIRVAVRFKEWVCVRSVAGTANSNPESRSRLGCMSLVNVVFSGSELRDGPIPGPEESYLIRVFLTQCGQETSKRGVLSSIRTVAS